MSSRLNPNSRGVENPEQDRSIFFTSEKNRRPNKLQKKAGQCDITLYANDQVIFNKVCQKDHENNIKKELVFRGLSTDGEWKADLIARLTHAT
jgi:hypothetical protein